MSEKRWICLKSLRAPTGVPRPSQPLMMTSPLQTSAGASPADVTFRYFHQYLSQHLNRDLKLNRCSHSILISKSLPDLEMLILYATIGLSFVSYMSFRRLHWTPRVRGHPPLPLSPLTRNERPHLPLKTRIRIRSKRPSLGQRGRLLPLEQILKWHNQIIV